MITCKIEVKNKVGLHARPASLFVKEAKMFKSSIWVKQDGKKVNGKSILEVLTLGAKYGSEIEIIASGEDEDDALQVLTKIVVNDTL